MNMKARENIVNKISRDSILTKQADTACSVKSYANNIAIGATVGVGAAAIPCAFTTGAYLGCVAFAGISGAAGGAFQSAVECSIEQLDLKD